MRRRNIAILAILLVLGAALNFAPVKSQVNVSFFIKDAWWGTYNSRINPQPGDKNVPLTIVIQQQSSYYLRGVIGYVELPQGFTDPRDDDNITRGDGVAIETSENAQSDTDIIPYGSFYITVYVDVDENVTKGDYTMSINITYYAYNDSGYYDGTPYETSFTITFPNRAPDVKERDPDSDTVTVYVDENQTFSIKAEDPDDDNITYEWKLDDEVVLSGDNATNYTYIATRDDRGTHTLEVKISDGEDETTVTWTINVPNRAPEVKDQNPSDNTVTIYVGDNRTFSVVAEDPDGDNITYTWYLDGDKILSGANVTNYTYFANDSDVGGHTLTVEISDDEDTTRVTWNINVDIVSKTEVIPSEDYVYAGKKINVTVTITNNIWQGTVEIDVSYPDYVAFFSKTHWTFRNVNPEDNITMVFYMYVPAKVLTSFGEVELIGQTLDITLDLSFSDVYGRSHQESQSAEFIIRGEVLLRYFGAKVEPYNLTAGDIATASVTILNVGVSSAMYSNATILPNPYIEIVAESFYYIGDVEPGSPTPVLVKFKIKDNVSPGTYNVTIVLFYFDDIYEEHYMYITISYTVHEKPKITQEEQENPIEAYVPILYGIGVVIALLVFVLILKKQIGFKVKE